MSEPKTNSRIQERASCNDHRGQANKKERESKICQGNYMSLFVFFSYFECNSIHLPKKYFQQ